MADSLITPRLLATLEELHTLLEPVEPRWAASMLRLSRRAAAAESSAEARAVLGDVLSLFAGMGSLNDLALQDRSGVLPEQQELSKLSARLYEEGRAGL